MTTSVAPGQEEFLEDLVRNGHLLPSGEPGLYGRGMLFEQLRMAFEDLVTRTGAADQPETPRFPPLIPKSVLEKAGYLRSFPQLAGAVFSFLGDEADARDMADLADRNRYWSMHLSMTELVLVPAACYPAYPAMARRGPLPKGGPHSISAGPMSFAMSHPRTRAVCRSFTSGNWCASAKLKKSSPGGKHGSPGPTAFSSRLVSPQTAL